VDIALVLVSAFLHALWNALLRLEADKDRALVAAVTVATVLAVIVAVARWSATGVPPLPTTGSIAWSLTAGVLELAYFITLARALERGPLGPVYTVSRGGAILVTWPLSVALFSEVATPGAIAGSVAVLAGVVLAGRTSGSSPMPRRALGWAIVCAVAIAGYHLAYKAAMDAGGSSSAVFALALGLATAVNYVRLGRAGRRVAIGLLRTRTLRLAMMGVICGGSFLLLIQALASSGAGFALTARNTSVLFATILAAAMGEKPRAPQIAGAVFVAAGAVAMAWP
jgi:drug/metabolite transporter (DMT)-like permease